MNMYVDDKHYDYLVYSNTKVRTLFKKSIILIYLFVADIGYRAWIFVLDTKTINIFRSTLARYHNVHDQQVYLRVVFQYYLHFYFRVVSYVH